MLDKFRETAITWDKANRKVYEPLRVSAGDNKGRKLSVQVVNGGVIEDLSGASLSLFWETKDKAYKGLDAFDPVDATKGEFELSYTTGMLSNEGTLNANLVLVDASGRVVSEPFTITVFKGIDDDAIQSSNSFTALAEALITVNQYNSRITNVENNKADKITTNALTGRVTNVENNKVDKSTFEQSTNDLTAQLQQNVINLDLFKKRDSDIDDNERMQRAIDYCSEHNIPLNLNGGLYYVRSLTMPAGITINGNGAIFKKPDLTKPPYSMTPAQMKWVRVLSCTTYSGDEDSDMTTVEGITFDGNCWTMWDAPSYEQEQASLFYADADNLKPGRLNLRITNCHFMNNVSDGVHVRNNVNLQIDNCSSFDCFRGGLVITGGYSKIVGNNLQFRSERLNDGIDIEVDGRGFGDVFEVDITFSNIMIDNDLDIAVPDNSVISVSNLHLDREKGRYVLSCGNNSSLKISDSVLVTPDSSGTSRNATMVRDNANITFNNVDFYLTPYSTSNSNASYVWFNGVDSVVNFLNCSFDYLGDVSNDIIHCGIRTTASATGVLNIDNCYFSDKLSYGVAAQVKELTLKDVVFKTRFRGAVVTSNNYNPETIVTLNNVQTKNDEMETILHMVGVDYTIKHLNTILDENDLTIVSGTQLINLRRYLGERVIYVTESNLSNVFGLVGDRAISKNVDGVNKPKEWRCVSVGTGNWVEI